MRAGVADDVPRTRSNRPARAVSSAEGVVLRDLVETLLQWKFVTGRLGGMPMSIRISLGLLQKASIILFHPPIPSSRPSVTSPDIWPSSATILASQQI